MMKYITLIAILITSLSQWSCEDMLEVSPPSEFDTNVLKSEKGIRALLFSSYRAMQASTPSRWVINTAEVTTDVGFNTGGAENLMMVQLINFTWDPSLGTFLADSWAPNYRCIRDANLVLENLAGAAIADENKRVYGAEARLLRAYSYAELYKMFGPVPLRDSSTSPVHLARATDEEMKNYIEANLLAAVPDLPDPGSEEAYGRANKGMAWAILAKFYLNTRQWQKAAEASQEVMALNYYALYPEFENMFRVENEGNKEMIMVIPCLNQVDYGNWFTAGALPPKFRKSSQTPDYEWQSTMANFATQYRLRSAFVNTFDMVNDRRAILVLRSYTNTDGANINLMAIADNARSLKYWDNNTVGNHSGNDVPLIRYADILLTRAEALNELSPAPTQEALDLLNEVRVRAGIVALDLVDVPTKEVFRDVILRERAWEFVSEGKRREDLLRHDKFISSAQARGIAAATEKHKLFPIPQSERDANPLCGQNDY